MFREINRLLGHAFVPYSPSDLIKVFKEKDNELGRGHHMLQICGLIQLRPGHLDRIR